MEKFTLQMDEIKVIQVILCSKKRRGSGKDTKSPVRIIQEVFTMDGKLIAEDDPLALIARVEELGYSVTKPQQ